MLHWAAIAAISGALSRNVCVRLQQTPIYPNMYILLIGGPGVGKSRAISAGRELLLQTSTNVAPAMTTRESFLMRLGQDASDEKTPGWMRLDMDHPFGEARAYVSSTVAVMSDEFTNFVQENDTLFMDALTELYDSPSLFEKFTKSSGSDTLRNVAVTMIGGTTPDALKRVLPDAAFKQGFASRLNLIYSDEAERKSLFGGESKLFKASQIDLLHDLQAISMLKGEYIIEPEVAQALDKWYLSGMRPAPTHPRLITYNERRHIHLVKLMMIFAAASSNELVLRMEHLEKATKTLLESEIFMVEALTRMGTTDDVMKLDDAIMFLRKWLEENKDARGVPEIELRGFLIRRMKPHEIGPAVSEMLSGGMIKSLGGFPGARLLVPITQ